MELQKLQIAIQNYLNDSDNDPNRLPIPNLTEWQKQVEYINDLKDYVKENQTDLEDPSKAVIKQFFLEHSGRMMLVCWEVLQELVADFPAGTVK